MNVNNDHDYRERSNSPINLGGGSNNSHNNHNMGNNANHGGGGRGSNGGTIQSTNSKSNNGGTVSSGANLEQIFMCFICYDKVQNAVMCPHCSKLSCGQCIKVTTLFKLITILLEMVDRDKTIMPSLQDSVVCELIS